MSILDRYIVRQFLVNLVILFVVLTGLIVLLDLIINFDEFAEAVGRVRGEARYERSWRLTSLIVDFYWPMVFLFYTYMVGLLPVAAAGFTLGHMMRHRELTAMLAGGVSLYRIALPICIVAFAAQVLLMVNQQVMIPRLADKLIRSHTALGEAGGQRSFRITFMPDGQGALFTCGRYNPARQQMPNLTILRRDAEGRAIERITADQATWDEPRHGWELVNGYAVSRPAAGGGVMLGDPTPIELYATDLDPTMILSRKRSRYRELLSLDQLNDLISKADQAAYVDAAQQVREVQRIRHSRFSLPVMNMLILLMGLPLFLVRAPVNLLARSVMVAPLCIGAWASGFLILQIAPGSLSPAAVAWLPVAMYLPIAYYQMDRIET